MLSSHLLADAPTGSGQNLIDLGNPTITIGSVNSGNNGADSTAAKMSTASVSGYKTSKMMIIGNVEERLCFSTVKEVIIITVWV